MRGHGRPREFSKSGVLQVLKIVDVGVSEAHIIVAKTRSQGLIPSG